MPRTERDEDWTVLATAPGQLTAEMWVSALIDAGIPARIRPSDTASFLGLSPFACRVQVRRQDLEPARHLLGLD